MPTPSGPPLAAGWQRIDIAKVSGDPAEKLAAAQGAMKALGTKLTQTMAEAVGEAGDFSAGITACQQAAPTVAKSISEKFDVEVGRTSFKVRNPSNRPRAWAKPIVDARYDKPIYMKGPQGQHAFMAPIRLAELCVNCHGTEAQISEPVKAALSQRYPNDQATGFAPGDLRGWFWVEFTADEG